MAVFCTVFSTLLLLAAVSDFALRQIPNWVCVAVFAVGILIRLVTGDVLAGVAFSAGVFVFLLLLWSTGVVGGGDVKLAAAAAVAVPVSRWLTYPLAVALAGGALAMAYLVLFSIVQRPPSGQPSGLVGRLLKAERWRISRRGAIPYGAAIAAGAMYVVTMRLQPFVSR